MALRDDLMELKPTLFAGVPRVFEKVYEGKFTNPHVQFFIIIKFKYVFRSYKIIIYLFLIYVVKIIYIFKQFFSNSCLQYYKKLFHKK